MIVAKITAFLFLLVIYFIPSHVAHKLKVKKRLGIYLLNYFSAFTFVGWIICLIWSVTGEVESDGYDVTKMTKYDYIVVAIDILLLVPIFLIALVVLFL